MFLLLSFLALPTTSFAIVTFQDTIATDDLIFTDVTTESDTTDSTDTLAIAAADSVVKSAPADTLNKVSSSAGIENVNSGSEEQKSLWETFIAGLIGGFLAFIMPCIFPMVPLTISYFTKRAGSREKGIGQALIYGLSIIVIYVAFGLLITVLFGSAGLNALSASGLFNFLFFLLLVVFAISFFITTTALK